MSKRHERSTFDLRSVLNVVSRLVAGVVLASLVGCASRTAAPVEERPPRGAQAVAPKPAPPPPPTPTVAPEPRPSTYTVKRGDTLYAIALDHGLDYRELAGWNNIENINLIRVGQVLALAPPGEIAAAGAPGVQTAPLKTVPPVGAGEQSPAPAMPSTVTAGAAAERNSENYKVQPKAVKEPYSDQAYREMQRSGGVQTTLAPQQSLSPPPSAGSQSSVPVQSGSGAQASVAAPPQGEAPPPVIARADPKLPPDAQDREESVEWVWPAKGKIVTAFSEAASFKGIDIAGTAGQPIAASASGRVVYAGSGLRGYGKLIIIKHNNTFLSAYAHNRDILVKEGQQVVKGQKIAEMGNTDADQVKLHFEIRRQGKPMDPLRYLPPA